MQETWIWSLGREDPLEKEMAIHSSIPAWRIPWTEKPSRLQSTGSQRVGHDWATAPYLTLHHLSFMIHWIFLNSFLWSFSVYFLKSSTLPITSLKNFFWIDKTKMHIILYLSLFIYDYIFLYSPITSYKDSYLNVQMNVKLFVLNAEHKKDICWLVKHIHLLSSLYFSQPLLYRISLNSLSSHIQFDWLIFYSSMVDLQLCAV